MSHEDISSELLSIGTTGRSKADLRLIVCAAIAYFEVGGEGVDILVADEF